MLFRSMTLYNSDSSGQMSTWGSEHMKKMEEILSKGDVLKKKSTGDKTFHLSYTKDDT